jgi:plastocyanin
MIQDIQGLWNNLVNLIGQIIAPDWGVVISWVPYLLALLVLVGLAFLVVRWAANRVWTASRLPARRTAPPPPAGTHLPGPSPWPFVAPIGAAIVLLGLVWKSGRVEPPSVDPVTGAITLGQGPAGVGDLFNLPVLLLGLLVVVVGIIGWYRDARHEWVRVEQGHVEPEPAPSLTAGELVLPPGVHLPGPSPWPLFVPVGAAVALLGLVMSPALVLGGILMAVLAIVGWYLDARHEYEFVAAGSLPEPRTRDPERAFPKALAGIYVAIALVSVMLAATPSILTYATAQASASATAAASGGGAGGISLSAQDVKFQQTSLTAAAGKGFTVTLTNHDTVPHNFAILKPGGGPSDFLFNGQPLTQGGQTTPYSVPALPAGTYTFICIVHPTQMTGTLTIK